MATNDLSRNSWSADQMQARGFDTTFEVPAVEMLGLNAAGTGLLRMAANPGLQVPVHDYIALTYTGSNLTGVVFKTGGSGGTTVATLTLAYSGSTLTSVTRT